MIYDILLSVLNRRYLIVGAPYKKSHCEGSAQQILLRALIARDPIVDIIARHNIARALLQEMQLLELSKR